MYFNKCIVIKKAHSLILKNSIMIYLNRNIVFGLVAIMLMLYDAFSQEVEKNWNLPSMIVHGEKDVVLPLKDSQELCEFLPNSQFKILEGQGHSCNIENPKLLMSLLNDFWSTL